MKLDTIIETMNERQGCFISKVRECGLLYEIDHSPFFYRLVVSLYDDHKSSLPLEPDFMAHTPLIGLEEVVDPPFVASSLSDTPRDTNEGVLSLFVCPLPLAQYTRLEMAESLRADVSHVEMIRLIGRTILHC